MIARMRTGFDQKFGIPRQAGLVPEATGCIVFEGKYKDPNYVEGIDQYDYLWLLWGFSENRENDGATVRPPRLGGKKHMGVFATRSPFRPNNIGLSSVKLIRTETTKDDGTLLWVSGVDMLDGTPIYDIKPYLPYTDAHPEAAGGFAEQVRQEGSDCAEVKVEPGALDALPADIRDSVIALIKQDPRAAYDKGRDRQYRMSYMDYDIVFEAREGALIITGTEHIQY